MSVCTDQHFQDLGPCWLWLGELLPKGYGRLSARKNGKHKKLYAHRVSHEFFKGPIPAGYDVDHKCRVRRCIAPDHLQAVPMLKNRGEYVQRARKRQMEAV